MRTSQFRLSRLPLVAAGTLALSLPVLPAVPASAATTGGAATVTTSRSVYLGTRGAQMPISADREMIALALPITAVAATARSV